MQPFKTREMTESGNDTTTTTTTTTEPSQAVKAIRSCEINSLLYSLCVEKLPQDAEFQLQRCLPMGQLMESFLIHCVRLPSGQLLNRQLQMNWDLVLANFANCWQTMGQVRGRSPFTSVMKTKPLTGMPDDNCFGRKRLLLKPSATPLSLSRAANYRLFTYYIDPESNMLLPGMPIAPRDSTRNESSKEPSSPVGPEQAETARSNQISEPMSDPVTTFDFTDLAVAPPHTQQLPASAKENFQLNFAFDAEGQPIHVVHNHNPELAAVAEASRRNLISYDINDAKVQQLLPVLPRTPFHMRAEASANSAQAQANALAKQQCQWSLEGDLKPTLSMSMPEAGGKGAAAGSQRSITISVEAFDNTGRKVIKTSVLNIELKTDSMVPGKRKPEPKEPPPRTRGSSPTWALPKPHRPLKINLKLVQQQLQLRLSLIQFRLEQPCTSQEAKRVNDDFISTAAELAEIEKALSAAAEKESQTDEKEDVNAMERSSKVA